MPIPDIAFLLASTVPSSSLQSLAGGPTMSLQLIDYAILAVYLVMVVGIGFALKRRSKSADDFLLSGRSIPGWITGLAFISANLALRS